MDLVAILLCIITIAYCSRNKNSELIFTKSFCFLDVFIFHYMACFILVLLQLNLIV